MKASNAILSIVFVLLGTFFFVMDRQESAIWCVGMAIYCKLPFNGEER